MTKCNYFQRDAISRLSFSPKDIGRFIWKRSEKRSCWKTGRRRLFTMLEELSHGIIGIMALLIMQFGTSSVRNPFGNETMSPNLGLYMRSFW